MELCNGCHPSCLNMDWQYVLHGVPGKATILPSIKVLSNDLCLPWVSGSCPIVVPFHSYKGQSRYDGHGNSIITPGVFLDTRPFWVCSNRKNKKKTKVTNFLSLLGLRIKVVLIPGDWFQAVSSGSSKVTCGSVIYCHNIFPKLPWSMPPEYSTNAWKIYSLAGMTQKSLSLLSYNFILKHRHDKNIKTVFENYTARLLLAASMKYLLGNIWIPIDTLDDKAYRQ